MYDQLGRLSSATTAATGPQWGESYTYDGFSNLTGKTVTKNQAPTLSINVDGTTNRITTYPYNNYDANGNQLIGPGEVPLGYDTYNRLISAGNETYTYGAGNLRHVEDGGSGTRTCTSTACAASCWARTTLIRIRTTSSSWAPRTSTSRE